MIFVTNCGQNYHFYGHLKQNFRKFKFEIQEVSDHKLFASKQKFDHKSIMIILLFRFYIMNYFRFPSDDVF